MPGTGDAEEYLVRQYDSATTPEDARTLLEALNALEKRPRTPCGMDYTGLRTPHSSCRWHWTVLGKFDWPSRSSHVSMSRRRAAATSPHSRLFALAMSDCRYNVDDLAAYGQTSKPHIKMRKAVLDALGFVGDPIMCHSFQADESERRSDLQEQSTVGHTLD